MKLGTVILLSVLVAAPACGGGGGSSPAAPIVAASFTPDPSAPPTPGPKTAAMAQGPKANDVVTVNVTLTGANNVTATSFEVVYNNANTTYVGFTPGTAFEQGGATPKYEVNVPTLQPNRIFVSVTRNVADGSTNVSGTMTVVGLQFRVKQAGTYPLVVPPSDAAVFDDSQPVLQIPGVAWYAGSVVGS
jgi:hypothetical protein